MINIWLDDVRPAPDGWLWATTASECFEFLTKNPNNVGILSLDHDLGDHEPTGYDLVKVMCSDMDVTDIMPKHIYLHTSNPVGRKNMLSLFTRFIQHCVEHGSLHEDSVKVHRGPHWLAWEQSKEKAKELGYF